MNERIKRLAKQAGLQPYYDKEFIRFAELVIRDEREACARIIKDMVEQGFMDGHALKAVKAIRDRGNK